MEKLTCLRCRYQWYPRSEAKPKVCSRCKSFHWEEPKTPKDEAAVK